MKSLNIIVRSLILAAVLAAAAPAVAQKTGVGVKPPKAAEIFFDGSRKMLDDKWTYWQGPRFAGSFPIKWTIVKDPVGKGMALNANDPTAAGGKYGTADIVTKKQC